MAGVGALGSEVSGHVRHRRGAHVEARGSLRVKRRPRPHLAGLLGRRAGPRRVGLDGVVVVIELDLRCGGRAAAARLQRRGWLRGSQLLRTTYYVLLYYNPYPYRLRELQLALVRRNEILLETSQRHVKVRASP